MDLFVIRRRSAWANSDELQAAGTGPQKVGEKMSDRLRWIRSYIVNESDGRLGSVCIYEARDRDAIREHGRRIDSASEEFQKVINTVVVSDDPS